MLKTILWFSAALLGGMAYALGAPSPYLPHHPLWAIAGMSIFLASLSLLHPQPGPHPLRHDLEAWGLFSLGLYLVGFNWIPGTMQDFGGLSAGWSYLLGALSALILAPHILIFIGLMHFLTRHFKSFDLRDRQHASFKLLGWAVIWLFLENFIPQQFPYHLGHSWMRLAPYIAPATIGGEPLYSGTFTWLALAAALFIQQRRLDWWAVSASLALIITSFLTPLTNPYLDAAHGVSFQVRLVQGSIGNDLKVRAERGQWAAIQEVQKIYHGLSSITPATPLDLIIWPETAIHVPFNSNHLKEIPLINLPLIVQQTVRQQKTDLFAGGYDIFDQQQFNSAFYFGYTGAAENTTQGPSSEGGPKKETGVIRFGGYYHKIKLLAFGETLPFGPLNPYLFKWVEGLVSNFAAGTEYPVFTTSAQAHFIATICYEILLSGWLRSYLQQIKEVPDFIVNLTNDSWFGVTAEPAQHLFLAKWRAVEFQKAVIRSTNSGISTIIYPNGLTGPTMDVNVRAVLDQTIYLDPAHPAAPTIYQRYGLGIVVGLAALLLILIRILALPPKSNWQIKAKFKFKF